MSPDLGKRHTSVLACLARGHCLEPGRVREAPMSASFRGEDWHAGRRCV